MFKVVTKGPDETKKIAERLAHELSRANFNIIALTGELGSGKTTFAQGFARALGIKERIQSPTFVLLKIYKIKKGTKKHFIHADCYRIDSPRDLLHVGFKKLLQDKDAIILIEWADRIRGLLPKTALWVKFRHGKKSHERIISIKL